VGIFRKRIGAALRALRKEAGLTQRQLAEARGRNEQGRLSRIETGREMPGVETIDAYLEVTQSSVFDLADALVGEEPPLEEIGEQVYRAYRLGALSPEAKAHALARINQLGWELTRDSQEGTSTESDPQK
jgi:transcriptional regulator with XRE-family HTH domain